MIDINFYEQDSTKKNCFQRHYAIRNILFRLIYVLSVAKNYNGKFKFFIKLFSFTSKIFKKIKNKIERMNIFYIDAGFETKTMYFKYLKIHNYYGLKLKIPVFYKHYFLELYGNNWRTPDKKYYWEKNKNKKILS